MSEHGSPLEQGHSLQRTADIFYQRNALNSQYSAIDTGSNALLQQNASIMTTYEERNADDFDMNNERDNKVEWQTVTNKRHQLSSPTDNHKRPKLNSNLNLIDTTSASAKTSNNNNDSSANRFSSLHDECDNDNVAEKINEEATTKPPPIIIPNISDISGMIKYFVSIIEKSEFSYKALRDGQIRIMVK